MPWFKVDDGFYGHPKVIELSLEAVGLWTLAGSWCASYLTDGKINLKAIRRLGGDKAQADELANAGLWKAEPDDEYQFKDWDDYQPLKADVEAERDAARERMQAVRAKKKGVQANHERTTDERSDGVQPNSSGTFGRRSDVVRLTPTRPTRPDPEGSKEPSPDTAKKRETKIPDDWAPTAAHIKTAKEKNIDVMDEAENFKLHAETHDRRAASWNGAFSTWLKKAKPKPVDQSSIIPAGYAWANR